MTTTTRTRRSRHVVAESGEPMNNIEITSLVCNYFCKGHLPTEIMCLLKEEHGIELHREQPYRYLSYAAKRGWLRFQPPAEYAMADRLRDKYRWLHGVNVTHSAAVRDVAFRTAETLIELLRTRARTPQGQQRVRVGFAGGHAMRSVARRLAELLRESNERLPDEVVFHALVSGFDVKNPTTDPKAFFSYLYDDTAMPMKTAFLGLHAPPVVKTREMKKLMTYAGISEAFEQRENLDIIVTSGASWNEPCPHSMLRKCYADNSAKSLATLEANDCIGDMLWRPINAKGPITAETEIRAMTLIELTDLPKAIGHGSDVLFMLGPCGLCHTSRGDLLRAILDMEQHLITHVVTDSRTAAAALR